MVNALFRLLRLTDALTDMLVIKLMLVRVGLSFPPLPMVSLYPQKHSHAGLELASWQLCLSC